jgi:hypothetical protein
MLRNLVRVLGKCVRMKTFWCCSIVATTCAALFFEHSFHACAGLALFTVIGVFSVFEEFNELP